jgi:hypothetical protein
MKTGLVVDYIRSQTAKGDLLDEEILKLDQ